ncbi:helix-turn-helix domain-containing protein [Paenibacillus hodogayensis]|uniref:Helix-turn-helix domain-containing protein n=1 Tax=Paenibacillus hodogayensis TaxID=279208 RepID=A0ABV5VZM5_9BACL
MHSHHPGLVVPFRSLLFTLTDIKRLDCPVGWSSGSDTSSTHALIACATGEGTATVNGSSSRLAPGKCMLVSPGATFAIDNGHSGPLQLHVLFYNVFNNSDGPAVPYDGALLADNVAITVYPAAKLLRLLDELREDGPTADDLVWFRRQLRFQEVLYLLLEHLLQADPWYDSTRAVERTIDYMRSHYDDNVTVKQLAEAASIAQWQYSSIFHTLTGQKPLDYLTELRINRAKELLLQDGGPLREIARKVGFRDEYYFNRRFRQTTGTTPKQFAKTARRFVRITDCTGHEVDIPLQPKRIVYLGETFGDMLALDVEPVGGGRRFAQGSVYERRLRNVEDVGWPLDADKLRALEPDLVIFATSNEKRYREIAAIAPTVSFNTFAPLEQRLRKAGELLGRRELAELWLSRYETRAETMWRRLASLIRPGETATALIFDHGDRLFVMGTAGFSSGIYHPHGFRPVERVREMLEAGHGFAEIDLACLPEYAGDRIFMLQPCREDSRKAAEALMASPLWNSLEAVRSGRVHLVDALKWNNGDAITREKLLRVLPGLLGRRTS